MALISYGQQIALKKGGINDHLVANDSLAETYSLFLPSNFESKGTWPLVMVLDLKGNGRQAMRLLLDSAEREGYLLATPNAITDTLKLTDNVLAVDRVMDKLFGMLPVDKQHIYLAGFGTSARFATLVPAFIKNIKGVVSCGAGIANQDVLSAKRPFHFMGIIGNGDFNYMSMREYGSILDRLKHPNNMLVFEGGHQWPTPEYLTKALQVFKLSSMAKGEQAFDSTYVQKTYKGNLNQVNEFMSNGNPLLAISHLKEMEKIYRPLREVDSLREYGKTIRRTLQFREQNRKQKTLFLKESLTQEDYSYYLEEDIITYNFNNLGWWNHQMNELGKLIKSGNVQEQRMGMRLKGYLEALVADNVDLISKEKKPDFEALNFLWMLQTILNPKEYAPYMKVISHSAKMEDYGTALFYLEEMLKNGFADKKKLYEMKDTALFRITPEFNELVEKYLKGARYEPIEE